MIDEAWVRALAEVEKRSKAMDAKSKEQRNIKGVRDLKPLLENLVNKVRQPEISKKETADIYSRLSNESGIFL